MAVATVGISAMAVSSCAYDPYYTDSRQAGYGYGNRSFTTVHFVRTNNPRWGYDPRVRCYYDYNRRCYYDPYLNGYYPAGYQPVYVHGVPHPHGWSSGHRYISPPIRVRDYRLEHYRQREQSYRSLNQDWSRHIHTGAQKESAYSYQREDSRSRLFDQNNRRSHDAMNERRENESQQRVIGERDVRKTERTGETRSEPWIQASIQERNPVFTEPQVSYQHEAPRQFERQEREKSNFGNAERSSMREAVEESAQKQAKKESSEQRVGRSPRAR